MKSFKFPFLHFITLICFNKLRGLRKHFQSLTSSVYSDAWSLFAVTNSVQSCRESQVVNDEVTKL